MGDSVISFWLILFERCLFMENDEINDFIDITIMLKQKHGKH